MPAVPPTSPQLGLPRFASDSGTRIWDLLNSVVDRIDNLFGGWTAYNPVWSQSDGTVLSVGAGSLVGRYKKLGKTVHVQIRLERAADSNLGTGPWIFSLPSEVTQRSWNMLGGGFAMYRDGAWFGGSVFPVATGSVGAMVGDLGRVSNNIPKTTHAAGDWYSIQATYEAA